MLFNALSWLLGTKPKEVNNKCLYYWAQVIILPQKVDFAILKELLHKFCNFNNVEFITTLDSEIAKKKSLNKLIQSGYQKNKQAKDIITALCN